MRSFCAVAFTLMLCALLGGCHYAQNRLDDFSDIFILGVGGTVANETPFPPGIGLYLEGTEFMHLGGMFFSGTMAEVDRRGVSITKVEEDTRWGIGPFHRWHIDEAYGPANIYKAAEMGSWEERMESKALQAPAFLSPFRALPETVPAKRVRFHKVDLGPFPRGYQDWGFIGIDTALSEPFLLHAGFRIKTGIDISQIADFIVGIFGLDMYGDDASRAEYEGLYEFASPGA